jgi:hypothetical protein
MFERRVAGGTRSKTAGNNGLENEGHVLPCDRVDRIGDRH